MGLYPAGGKLQQGVTANQDGSYTMSMPSVRRPRPAQNLAESPYDIVGGYSAGGQTHIGRPRWQVDLERQKAELELEQLRWMIDQMRRNPNGVSIRDLIYGKGGR